MILKVRRKSDQRLHVFKIVRNKETFMSELSILQAVKGFRHVIQLAESFQIYDCNILVLPYFRFNVPYRRLKTYNQTKQYMQMLLSVIQNEILFSYHNRLSNNYTVKEFGTVTLNLPTLAAFSVKLLKHSKISLYVTLV